MRTKATSNNERILISDLRDGLYYVQIEKHKSLPFIKME